MKKLILLLFCLCLTFSLKAENNNANHLLVWTKGGEKVAYKLSEKPKITFTDYSVNIETQGLIINYPYDNFSRFTFELNNETAIKDILSDKPVFSLNGEFLLFPELRSNSILTIINIEGKAVLKKVIKAPGSYSIPISLFPKGVYIVNINHTAYKINIR